MNKHINNRGFTLVELLAVIVILLGIAAVSIFNISSSLRNNEEQKSEKQETLILNAAKIYFSLNADAASSTGVLVRDLVADGYFKEEDVDLYIDARICPGYTIGSGTC